MKKIRTLFATQYAVQKVSVYPFVYHFLEPLLPQAEETIDAILDEALVVYGTDLLARVNDINPNFGTGIKDARSRLPEFKESQEKTGNANKGAILANVYLKFEEYLRLGDVEGKHKRGCSELKAGRLVAKTMSPRAKLTRKNAAQNRLTQRYWYRYYHYR
jgi:hypothetical protein